MWAQTKLPGNLAIGQALGHAIDDLRLSLGKQIHAPCIDGTDAAGSRDGLHQSAHLFAISPDLSLVHSPYAFILDPHRFVPAEDSTRTGTKCFQHHFML
jgi:hypothetical protein